MDSLHQLSACAAQNILSGRLETFAMQGCQTCCNMYVQGTIVETTTTHPGDNAKGVHLGPRGSLPFQLVGPRGRMIRLPAFNAIWQHANCK